MALFHTEFTALDSAHVDAAKRWWVNSLPSDVAPKLPGDDEPTPTQDHPILFCNKIERAHEHLCNRGPAPGPIREPAARTSSRPAIPTAKCSRSAKSPGYAHL
jgi:hypothetical protein